MFGCRVLYRVSAISTQFCSDSGIALKSKVYYTTMGKNVKRHLTKENIQIARKQLLKNSTLHVIKEFHLKTRMRYQCTFLRTMKIQNIPIQLQKVGACHLSQRSQSGWHSHRCSESGKTTNKSSSHSLKTQK